MYIVVGGGGKVGYHLGRWLLGAGHELLLIERDRARCAEVERSLGENVLAGDASKPATLKRAGVNRADIVVAATGSDEDNLVICQVAKHLFMVGRTIARVNDPNNEELFRSLGVEGTINSTRLIDGLIEQEVDSANLIPLLTLGDGKLEIVQAEVGKDSGVLGRPVRDLSLSRTCRIVSVIRNGEPEVPDGGTSLKAGDTVVALLPRGDEEAFRRLLAA